MMRPIAALLITILLFAGVYGYTTFVDSVRRPPLQIQEAAAKGEYSVRIARTFDCVGDPDFDVDSLVVRFRGANVMHRTDTIPQSEIIEIRPLKNVVQLANELYVAANLKSDESDDWADDNGGDEKSDVREKSNTRTGSLSNAIRVQVMKGTKTLVDKTIWQEPDSSTISGSISFEAPVDDSDDHDH